MPRLTSLAEVENRLPSFVKIHPDTYRGMRYKAKFTDIDYKEDFEDVVYSVINLQNGCPARSNALRSQSARHSKAPVPLSEVLAKVPAYLELDISTYKGVRNKATFYDKEYKTKFEMIVANVIRTGKGYCKARQYDFVRVCNKLTPEDISEIVKSKYGDAISYVSGYEGQRKACLWRIDGVNKRIAASTILSGRYFDRFNLERWKAAVLARDWFTCQKCGSTEDSACHHIINKVNDKSQLFNVHNGIVLCFDCHTSYHSRHKFKETTENFLEWLGDKDKIATVRHRLTLPIVTPPLRNAQSPWHPVQDAKGHAVPLTASPSTVPAPSQLVPAPYRATTDS